MVYQKVRQNNDDVVISTLYEHLNIVILEEDVDRSHRVGKFDPAKRKSKPVIMKFVSYNVCHKVFASKRKLKGKGVSISKSLMKLCLVKLSKAKNQHSFGNVWSYEGKIMYNKDSNNKIKVFYD